jgi:hypothetical protein
MRSNPPTENTWLAMRITSRPITMKNAGPRRMRLKSIGAGLPTPSFLLV